MERESPPPASSPTAADNTKVLSRRTRPGQGEVQEAAKNMGEPTPMETGDGGHVQFGPQPNVILETHTVLESEEQPSLREGGVPTILVTSVNAEATATLVTAL